MRVNLLARSWMLFQLVCRRRDSFKLTFSLRSSFAEISGYLERQYDDILAEESRIKRNPRFRDNRVHVLLYFITPTGHA